MKLVLLSFILAFFYTGHASAKCCRMLVGGTVVDKHLGGPGSALVKQHQKICADINEKWKTTGVTHSACVTAPNEFYQKSICDKAKDQSSCGDQTGPSGKSYCKWSGSACVVNYANFESFCAQENDDQVCERIYGAEKKGCCGINDKVKDQPYAYDWFQSCKSKDKQGCNGDCEWKVAPKLCEEPKKPGCCGHNETIKPNGGSIVGIFNYCKNQDYKSCSGSCQWNLPPKECLPPKVDVVTEKPGCCGVNEQVKNDPYAYKYFQACKLKDKNSCQGDCQWMVAPNRCDEPKKPGNT